MFRTLLAIAVLLMIASATVASACDPLTDAEVLALAGPKTCSYGGFFDVLPRQVDIPIVLLDPGITQEYCFHLPRVRRKDIGSKLANGFVTLHTANLANTSCGTATVYMIRPKRKSVFGRNVPRTCANVNQVQPAAILAYTPGTWRVLIRYESGNDDCKKYSLTVTW